MPAFFIPARSSRHRAACFALYRALLRQVTNISLPDELVTGWGKLNPLTYYIRAGFRRNRQDTSTRLVTVALTNGYRYLGLLHAARDASSPEHATILDFLRARLDRYHRNLAEHPPPPPRVPQPPSQPMLVRLPTPPGKRPVYAAADRPRPLAELKGGIRKVPVLTVGDGIPFLRVAKPQSVALTHVLKRKRERRQKWLSETIQMGAAIPKAEEEDRWEGLVLQQMRQEGVIDGVHRDVAEDRGNQEPTYASELVKARKHVYNLLDDDRHDLIARTRTMMDIVEQERRLAEEEEVERREKASEVIQDKAET